MHKHQLYINLLVTASALALTACADEVANVVTPDSPTPDTKTPIELSLGGVDSPSSTRAVITDDANKTYKPFEKKTRLFLYVKSEDETSSPTAAKYALTFLSASDNTSNNISTPAGTQLYWDDAHARESKLTVYACGVANSERLNMTISDKKVGKESSEEGNNIVIQNFLTEEINPTFTWEVGEGDDHNHFTQTDLEKGDLVFSNNISKHSDSYDKRLKYNTDPSQPTTYKKFDKGDLKFYHALSKFTFHIVKGDEFNDAEFILTTTNNIALKGFYGKGTFNMVNGEFNALTETDKKDFSYIAPTNTPTNDGNLVLLSVDSKKYYELSAYLVPGTNLKTASVSDAVTFTINNNEYKLSMSQLYNAILQGTTNATYLTANPGKVDPKILTEETSGQGGQILKAGVHYLFTLNIGKAKIDNITASVAEWEVVNAEDNLNNARITLQLDDRTGSNVSGTPAFYKASDHNTGDFNYDYKVYNWDKGYANMNATLSTDHWTTEYFWNTSKEFYHFRALLPSNNNAVNNLTGDPEEYVTISSQQTTSDAYDAVAWGAPFLQNKDGDSYKTFTYSVTNGFDGIGADVTDVASKKHQIYHAIGATESPIKMLLFHMMSGVHFTIKTTGSGDANTDKVQLYNSTGSQRTKVQLVGYLPNGKVYMGNGLVEATGTTTTTSNGVIDCATSTTGAYDNQDYYYSAIPQDLAGVQLYITTPDNNQYIVDMKDVKAKATNISSSNIANPYRTVGGTGADKDKYKIDRWYPGFKYNYTFTLKKTGITDITATVVNWETIEADNEDVTIK